MFNSCKAILTGAGLAFSLLLTLGLTPSARAVGSWTPLANQAPNYISSMLLLTDGTVLAQGADGGGVSSNWYRLTPDASGSYANGTWTTLAPMHHQRLYYASAVMQNGQVFVAGGEYSDNGSEEVNTAEIYNPLTNVWTEISGPPGWSDIGDAPLTVLADGRLLLGSIQSGQTALYNYMTGTWTETSGQKVNDNSSTEESWALLPDGSVLTVDCTGTQDDSEKYVPGSDAWVNLGMTPAGHHVVEDSSAEVGPAILLPNASVLYVGATGHTALYSTTNAAWIGGPDLPLVTDVDNTDSTYGQQVQAQAKDAPGCLLVNGNALCLAGPTGNSSSNEGYPDGQYFFEYTPDAQGGAGSLVAAPFPGGSISLNPAFVGRMVALPNGQVLYSNFDTQLYVYTPDSGPNAAWQPTVSAVTSNGDGSYKVTGTQFNGLSQASAYGDDYSDATNYPLVRLVSSSGQTYYCRTFNHSTMGVATGSAVVSTNFTLPVGLANGTYSLYVVANGIASAPVSFTLGSSGPTLASLTASPTTITGGPYVYFTAALTGKATSNATVSLSSSNPAALSVPSSATIGSGYTSVKFHGASYPVTAVTTVTITATYNGVSQTATVTVNPPALDELTITPGSITGGGTANLETILNAKASVNAAIALSSSNPSVLPVPASVAINVGYSTKTITLTSTAVTTPTVVTITGTYNGVSASVNITVNPVALASVTASPTTVQGGVANSSVTVALTSKATSTATVTLTSSNPAVLSVPASATIGMGYQSKTVTATSHTVTTSTVVTITATYNGVSKTTTVTVTP